MKHFRWWLVFREKSMKNFTKKTLKIRNYETKVRKDSLIWMDSLTMSSASRLTYFCRITHIYLFLFSVNLQIIELTVYTLFWRILKLRFKISNFLNSAYPRLFENFLTFIPRWPEVRDNAENIPWGFFSVHTLIHLLIFSCILSFHF